MSKMTEEEQYEVDSRTCGALAWCFLLAFVMYIVFMFISPASFANCLMGSCGGTFAVVFWRMCKYRV